MDSSAPPRLKESTLAVVFHISLLKYWNRDGSCVSQSDSARAENPYRNAPQQPLLVALIDDKGLRRTFRKDLIVLIVGQHFLLYGIRLWNGQLAANHRCLQTRFQT